VDEVSILQYPIIDGTFGTPSIFDIKKERPKPPAGKFTLATVEKLSHDILWLRYKVTME
jgi:riboflavin biosynthesis pyrimidine reductase